MKKDSSLFARVSLGSILLNLFCIGIFGLFSLFILHQFVTFTPPDPTKPTIYAYAYFIVAQDSTAAYFWLGATILALILANQGKEKLVEWSEHVPDWVSQHLLLVCGVTFVAYAGLTVFAGHLHPLSMDEYSVVFQSQVFAAGHITTPIPSDLIDFFVPKEFQGHFLQVSHARGEVVSTYWPGYALLGAPFAFLGVPLLANSFYTALSVWAVHGATRELTGSTRVAGWATLFMLASPTIAINAVTAYSMPAHLLFNALYLWLIAKNTPKAAFGAGLCGSYALLLHNPFPHLMFCIPLVIWVALKRTRLLGPLVVGYLLLAPLVLMKWLAFVGTFEIQQVTQAAGANHPKDDFLSRLLNFVRPPSALIWLERILAVGKMVVWAVPALFVFAFYGWKTRKTSDFKIPLGVLCASVALTFVAYLGVTFSQGHGWGFRYLQPVWFVFPISAAAFIVTCDSQRIRSFALCCTLLAFVILIPYRALQVGNFIGRQLAQLPATPTNSILFVNTKNGYYRKDLIQNDPFLRSNRWILESQGEQKDRALAQKYLPGAKRSNPGADDAIYVGNAPPKI